MIGHVVEARENYNRVVYEADGQYGYLDIVNIASLTKGDTIDGDIGTLGRKRVMKNKDEKLVEVQIGNYGISRAEALKKYKQAQK